MKPDYYRTLDVDRRASTEEIRIAYRALARSSHPDRAGDPGGAPDHGPMTLLNEAWSILGDPDRRRAYDQSLMVPEPAFIQDVILDAAYGLIQRSGVKGGGVDTQTPRDFEITGGVSVSVRLRRVLDSRELDSWLRVATLDAARRPDCAVILACRVLVPDVLESRLHGSGVPGVAIDLIDSRVFGRFPCARSAALFEGLL